MAEQYIEKIKVANNERSVRDAEALHNSEWLDIVYPVGTIYISTVETNPSNFFGGTWSLFSKGRTLIGVDPDDELFDGVRRVGGNRDATLPGHTHVVSGSVEDAGKHSHTANEAGGHAHNYSYANRSGFKESGDTTSHYQHNGWASKATTWGGKHTHTTTENGNHRHTFNVTSASAGGDASDANLPPYVTCYIWERVL